MPLSLVYFWLSTQLWLYMPPGLVDWLEYSHHFLSLSGQWHSNDYQPDCNFSCHSHLLIIDYRPNCSCRCHHDLLIEWNTLITSYHYRANDILMIINLIVIFDATLTCLFLIINPIVVVYATRTCWLIGILSSLLITIWPMTF